MSHFAGKKQRRNFEVTSLIDVVFILLIFFMVIIIPGSGGGDAESKDIDLPKMKGLKPNEVLDTLTFRIETDDRIRIGYDLGGVPLQSNATPNVIYCLLPYDIVTHDRGMTFEKSYEQAKKEPGLFVVIKPKGNGPFVGHDDSVRDFIESKIQTFKEDYDKNASSVLISAETDTPFGIIEFITDQCNDYRIINLDFRTAS